MFYRPKNIGIAVLVLLFSLCTASATRADTLTLTGFGDTLWEGAPVGPYPGTLNGTSTSLLCLSYDRHVSPGVPFEVTINALNALGVSNALYGPQLLGYQQAAWLYDQMLANPSETGDIHGAIWRLFTPGTPTTQGSDWWYNLATTDPATLAMIQGYDFSRFRIVTPNDRSINGQQEFLTTVPEPATMLLLGTGLAGVAARARRRRKAIKTEAA